ncbi:hypothetical protein ABTE09_20740, partial [Acinetobacter baumannii]
LIGAALLVFVLQSEYGLSTLTRVTDTLGFRFGTQDKGAQFYVHVVMRGAILGVLFFFLSWVLARAWPFVFGRSAQQSLANR